MLESFEETIKQDIDQLLATGRIQRAIELSSITGEYFSSTHFPLYFTGTLDSEIVLIHLNPQENQMAKFTFNSFEQYISYCSNFGELTYGKAKETGYRSPFDENQIYFLRPFGVIKFVEEKTERDKYINLEKVCSEKLQLELIPYASREFKSNVLTSEAIRPHVDRLISVISAFPRKYVLFCGQVFSQIFRQYLVKKPDAFYLIKGDGTLTKSKYKFCFINISGVKAGIAQSYAMQSLKGHLMAQYGQQCKELYDNLRDV